jgi:hypothetical protein
MFVAPALPYKAFVLTNYSNRIEKQISDIQAKSEEKKMAVSSLPLNTLFQGLTSSGIPTANRHPAERSSTSMKT